MVVRNFGGESRVVICQNEPLEFIELIGIVCAHGIVKSQGCTDQVIMMRKNGQIQSLKLGAPQLKFVGGPAYQSPQL